MLELLEKVFVYLLFLLYMCAFALTSCFGGADESDEMSIGAVSDRLGLDVSAGEVISNRDTHGGWLGDGETIVVIRFSGDGEKAVLADIMEQSGWNSLPLTENLSTAVYGKVEDNARRLPFFTDENQDPFLPEIKNGYYFFRDRSSESTDPFDASQLYNRASYNFTLAVYDMDQHTLYYFELDT